MSLLEISSIAFGGTPAIVAYLEDTIFLLLTRFASDAIRLREKQVEGMLVMVFLGGVHSVKQRNLFEKVEFLVSLSLHCKNGYFLGMAISSN